LRGEGIALLKDTIVDNLETPALAPLHIDYAELEESIRAFEGFLTQHHIDTGLPQRTTAIKILENDPDILKVAQADGRHSEVSRIAHDAERRCAADTESFIMERRYAYLKGLATECVRRHLTIHQRFTISDKIDKVVTNRFIGIPIFLGFMYGLFSLVFVVGEPMVNAIDRSFEFLAGRAAELIATAGLPAWCMSLVSDGIIAGVGSVLVFLPYILLLFLGITFLEHSGYLARAAFIMDRVMHALNLHGKSFIPMLLGFGCNIPAILATRTLESEKDRIITVLIVPLMSCSARLPVYTLFAAALFPRHRGLVVFSLYLLGVVLAVIMARIFKKVLFKGESSALVMELPPYRLPNIKHLAVHMWLMAWLFIKKAGTVIFAAVIVLWILASLPAGVEYGSPESIIGGIGRHLAPLFKPAGFGFWQAGVALVSGIVAKEVVVGTLGTLYGAEGAGLTAVLQQQFTPLSGYAFLVMTLIYIPCIAAIAVIRQETNWRWAGVAVGYTLALGWMVSVGVYQIGSALGFGP